MKVLLIHHLEECWDPGLNSHGTSFEKEVEKLMYHLDVHDYDLVILTRFEEWELGEEHWRFGLHCHVNQVYNYCYGWALDEFPEEEENVTWTRGLSHSEAVPLPEWLWDLKGKDVDLCGAFDGECIEDMEVALEAVGVDFNRLNHLIV